MFAYKVLNFQISQNETFLILKREFLINIGFLILINVLIKPVYIFFIDARVQDTLGSEKYGLYFGLFNLAYILYILTDLGMQNYSSKTIAQDNTLLKEYLPNILGIKIFLSIFYIIAGIVFAFIAGYDMYSIRIFMLIAINLILLSFILYLRTNIAAMGKYRLDSVISVIDKLILIVVLSVFIFSPLKQTFTIYNYIYAQTFAFIIVLGLVLRINFKMINKISIKFSIAFAKRLLKLSLPFSLVFLLMTLYMKMDGFMLERMLTTSVQAGIYAAAFRLYEGFNNIGYLFAVLLLPMFASLIQSGEKLKSLIHTSHNIMLVISVTATIIAFLYSREIMQFLYPRTFTHEHSILLKILMISFFAISLTYIYGTLLTAAGKISIFNKIVLTGVLVNLFLNLLLIPVYGAIGAAVATVFTQYLVLSGQYIAGLKYFDTGFNLKLFSVRTGFFLITATVVYIIKFQLTMDWIISIIISGIFSIFIAIIIGLIKFSDLKK